MRQRDFLPKMTMGMHSSLELSVEQLHTCITSKSLHAIFDSFHDGIIVYDGNGTLQVMNFTAERINDLNRNDFIGLDYTKLLQCSALDYAELEQALAQGANKAYIPNAKGQIFVTQIQYVPTSPRHKPYTVLLQYDAQQRDNMQPDHLVHANKSLDDPQQHVIHLSPIISKIADIGVRAFRRNARLLLLGEPGVGKTAIAKHIHIAAGWSKRPFVQVNCASIPEGLFEHEMFGYEVNTFAGALQHGKKGYIESAAGGTLFLDDIAHIPLHAQAKLLQFLEDGSIQRIGSPTLKKVHVQIMTASNQDIRALVERGDFRADLYYRLSVLPIEIPPLRAHLEDLPMLMQHLLEKINQQRELALRLSASCKDKLLHYHYPGNLRELVNIFERLAVLADDLAEDQHLPPELLGQIVLNHCIDHQDTSNVPQIEAPAPFHGSLKGHVQQFERQLILKTVAQQGSKIKAAQYLDIDVATLTRKLQRSEN